VIAALGRVLGDPGGFVVDGVDLICHHARRARHGTARASREGRRHVG